MPNIEAPDPMELASRRRAVTSLAEALGVSERSLRERADFEAVTFAWRRELAEVLGSFLLVFVAAGGSVVDARFGGGVVSRAAQAVAPGLMVLAIILFMGAVSGAHLNPVVSIAFALRRDFPWRRVPFYVGAQLVGAALAMLVLEGVLGRQGNAGLTLPAPGMSAFATVIWEAILTVGLVSVILGTASGAQAVGWGAAIGVGSYIALAGLIGSPVSGASMNPARSLGPALVVGNLNLWWVYVAGPLAGALVAVGLAWLLRGSGGGTTGRRAASGTLGEFWFPEPIHEEPHQAEEEPPAPTGDST